ncbi:MAG: DUF1015 domain-containing protein [Microscillaceae bacterium]|nr:DUF1015 domain-containing protein [Microscillaceae bacterium]MDW8459803.1 DUF1015 domain-containing protein [Cytophagales bacterium]
MPPIQPIRAWRYNSKFLPQLLQLTAPLAETLSQQREARLYEIPYHNFHISSPRDVPPYHNVSRRIEQWKKQGIILQDKLPALYVYFQYFSLKGSEKQFVRKGFIAHVKIDTELSERRQILPHEMTVPKAVAHRTHLLEATFMHTVPTHTFYTDSKMLLEQYLQESIKQPIYQLTDNQGTQHILSAIHDRKVIQFFQEVLRDKILIIADGHHRYESSQRFALQCRNQNPNHTGEEGYNYHLTWLTNTASNDIGLLPTHRIIRFVYDFHENSFLEALQTFFYIHPRKSLAEISFAQPYSFGLFLKDKILEINLKKHPLEEPNWNLPNEVKQLDLSVMHYFIFEKVLQIPANHQFNYLDFSQDATFCVREVQAGRAVMALLTKSVSFEQIYEICQKGYLMPAKSTYFYPKVLSGLVFSEI